MKKALLSFLLCIAALTSSAADTTIIITKRYLNLRFHNSSRGLI